MKQPSFPLFISGLFCCVLQLCQRNGHNFKYRIVTISGVLAFNKISRTELVFYINVISDFCLLWLLALRSYPIHPILYLHAKLSIVTAANYQHTSCKKSNNKIHIPCQFFRLLFCWAKIINVLNKIVKKSNFDMGYVNISFSEFYSGIWRDGNFYIFTMFVNRMILWFVLNNIMV